MKVLLKRKLIFPFVTLVLLTGVIVGLMVGNIFHAHAQGTPTVGSWTFLAPNVSISGCGAARPSVDPNNANILYVPTCEGLLKSVDGGTNWSEMKLNNQSVDGGSYGPIVVDPSNPNVLYIGATGLGIWKSTDGGANWSNLTDYLNQYFNVSYLAMDPNNHNVLYSGNYQSGGVWKSTDAGVTWTDTSLGNDIAQILIDPTNSNTVYASTAECVLYKSSNGGTTWSNYNVGACDVRGIAMDPNNANILYVGTSNGVYKSTNGGINWTALSNGPHGEVLYAVTTDPIIPNTIYAASSDNTIQTSSDGGTTWSSLNNNNLSSGAQYTPYLLVPAKNPTVLYASIPFSSTAGEGGIYEYGLRNAPSVGTITVSPNPVQINTSTSASATFMEPDFTGTHTATWNWGDGSTTTGTVTESNGSGSVSDSHTYTASGVYTITLTVTDDDGVSNTSTFQYVSVYNPTAQGLFSAGEKYTSPAGAFTANPSLSGTVKCGLSYKYDGSVPVGHKEFSLNFTAANFQFSATSVTSLVLANGIGTLRGTGTVNGAGTYSFLVTGSESANTIRIQMKDASGTVVYDTQPGAVDTATPTTSVTGHVLAH
jgi:photosystem II stability/assembly factor-like uncharacterized protein